MDRPYGAAGGRNQILASRSPEGRRAYRDALLEHLRKALREEAEIATPTIPVWAIGRPPILGCFLDFDCGSCACLVVFQRRNLLTRLTLTVHMLAAARGEGGTSVSSTGPFAITSTTARRACTRVPSAVSQACLPLLQSGQCSGIRLEVRSNAEAEEGHCAVSRPGEERVPRAQSRDLSALRKTDGRKVLAD